jgi:hypothetical protein
MATCITRKKVPITIFHCKNINEMLDMGPKIGKIIVLTSEYTQKIGNRMFPDVAYSSKFPRIQRLETDLFCPAYVPLAMQNEQRKKNGREKDRLTFKFFCLLVLIPTSIFIVS